MRARVWMIAVALGGCAYTHTITGETCVEGPANRPLYDLEPPEDGRCPSEFSVECPPPDDDDFIETSGRLMATSEAACPDWG